MSLQFRRDSRRWVPRSDVQLSVDMSVPGFKKQLLMDPKKLAYWRNWTDKAQEHALLTSADVPPGIKQALVKHLRGDGASRRGDRGRDDGTGEDHAGDDFTKGPLKSLLMQLLHQQKTPRRPPAYMLDHPRRPRGS